MTEKESIQTLKRMVMLLDCFTIDHTELGVREAARQTDFSVSTAGRLMMAMKDLGILSQNPKTHLYSLGAKVLAWGGIYTDALDVRNKALPEMHQLHQETMETISLYVLEGNERVCVERLESPQNVRIIARIGRRLPLYAGSAGKVFLAFLPAARRDEILHSSSLVPFTSSTIVNLEQLNTELEFIRSQGYAVSHGEWVQDASGVAAPVFDVNKDVIAALTISGPSQRFTGATVVKYATQITEVARKISIEMGFRGGPLRK